MAGSDSDMRACEVEGRAPGQGVAALSAALTQALAALMKEGGAPAHLTQMTWSAPDPAAIHPSRRAVDYAWREVFAGFRPPLRLAPSPTSETIVRAQARIPRAPASGAPVFQGYSLAELARQMSPRAQVPDIGAMFAQWSREGGAARARFGGLDIAYGAHRDECLDLYRPAGATRAPVWVFIHGGYWRATSKDQYAQFCAPMVEAGFAVANIDYPLAPETPLRDIVRSVRAALWFLVREADALGLDAAALHVAGHSAGGHLAAFMAADAEAPALASAHILSGVVDLESVFHIPMGPVLGLGALAQAHALSPLHMRPRAGVRIAAAVGGAESDEFKRQAQEIARAWGAPAPLVAPGANHFNLLDGFLGGDLLAQALTLCRG